MSYVTRIESFLSGQSSKLSDSAVIQALSSFPRTLLSLRRIRTTSSITNVTSIEEKGNE